MIDIIATVIQSFFTGLGSAIGTFVVIELMLPSLKKTLRGGRK